MRWALHWRTGSSGGLFTNDFCKLTYAVDRLLDGWVDDEVHLWDLDVLVEVEERQLELGHLLLDHGDAGLGILVVVVGKLGRVRVEEGRDGVTDVRMKGLVRRAGKEVEEVELGRDRAQGVQRGRALDEGDCARAAVLERDAEQDLEGGRLLCTNFAGLVDAGIHTRVHKHEDGVLLLASKQAHALIALGGAEHGVDRSLVDLWPFESGVSSCLKIPPNVAPPPLHTPAHSVVFPGSVTSSRVGTRRLRYVCRAGTAASLGGAAVTGVAAADGRGLVNSESPMPDEKKLTGQSFLSWPHDEQADNRYSPGSMRSLACHVRNKNNKNIKAGENKHTKESSKEET